MLVLLAFSKKIQSGECDACGDYGEDDLNESDAEVNGFTSWIKVYQDWATEKHKIIIPYAHK